VKNFNARIKILIIQTGSKGEAPNEAYNRLAQQNGIFAVEINSIRKKTEAIYKSWKELLATRISDQQGKIDKLEAKLKLRHLAPSKAHQWRRKLHRYQGKLASLKAEQASGIPKICFGSKDLFYRQFHLKENRFKNHAEWLKEWSTARSDSFYLAGRASERSGNNACILEVLETKSDSFIGILKLRKKNNEIKGPKAKAGDFIPIQVRFTYNSKYILQALAEKRPITYRFTQDRKGWHMQAIVDLPVVPIVTDVRNGSIGVDQNPLCIVWSVIKPDGNCSDSYSAKLTQGHRTVRQAEHELSNVVCVLVDKAVLTKRPIVIEKLDFAQLQKELKSRGLNRKLSRFKHSLFKKLLYGRSAKFGVEVIEVNPAFSSIIGWLKFGYGYGFDRHQAASIAIGRRVIRPNGKSFSERLRVRNTPGHPAASKLSRNTSAKPVRKRFEHAWTGWRRLGKLLASGASKSRSAGIRSRQAVSCQETGRQGSNPYPLEPSQQWLATPKAMDAFQNGSTDPLANRRGTVYAPA
jgi:IS605 OrfB family transposase